MAFPGRCNVDAICRSVTKVVFLSPHLDDAVLSLAPVIARFSRETHTEVWTVFSGAAWCGPYSATARWLHQVCGGRRGKMLELTRRWEDWNALKILGVRRIRHLGFLDAVYRKDARGGFLYQQCRETGRRPEDSGLVTSLHQELLSHNTVGTLFVAPLAFGGHVDHQIVRETASRLPVASVLWYCDLPYLIDIGRKSCEMNMVVGRSVHCTETDLMQWRNAIECYRTQLEMLRHEGTCVADRIVLHFGKDRPLTLFLRDHEA